MPLLLQPPSVFPAHYSTDVLFLCCWQHPPPYGSKRSRRMTLFTEDSTSEICLQQSTSISLPLYFRTYHHLLLGIYYAASLVPCP